MTPIKVAQFGLGPIGSETLKLAASKPWVQIVGGIDVDPNKIVRSLGQLIEVPTLKEAKVFRPLDELIAHTKPDVIFHTAVSKIRDAVAQVEPMARAGISVVSSCEELLFPALREPQLAKHLDDVCKRYGARVLGTGSIPALSWMFCLSASPACAAM